jgi:hypothetical protein
MVRIITETIATARSTPTMSVVYGAKSPKSADMFAVMSETKEDGSVIIWKKYTQKKSPPQGRAFFLTLREKCNHLFYKVEAQRKTDCNGNQNPVVRDELTDISHDVSDCSSRKSIHVV